MRYESRDERKIGGREHMSMSMADEHEREHEARFCLCNTQIAISRRPERPDFHPHLTIRTTTIANVFGLASNARIIQ